jgi:hypothetical protein
LWKTWISNDDVHFHQDVGLFSALCSQAPFSQSFTIAFELDSDSRLSSLSTQRVSTLPSELLQHLVTPLVCPKFSLGWWFAEEDQLSVLQAVGKKSSVAVIELVPCIPSLHDQHSLFDGLSLLVLHSWRPVLANVLLVQGRGFLVIVELPQS